MGALESAELDPDALREAVIRAREAEQASGTEHEVEVTGKRAIADVAQAAGKSPSALRDLPPSSHEVTKPQPPASRSSERSADRPLADEAGKKRNGSSVRVQVNERGRLAVGQTPLQGTLTDISMTGAFLASERTLAPGSEVTLRFSLPIGEDGTVEQVEVRAEVRHRGRGQSGIGLRFLRMPGEAMRTLERFLAEHA